jgi:hypothetical protein
LRNEKIWQIRTQVASHYANTTGYRSGVGIEATGIEAEAERLARTEGAWEVGERHVLAAIPKKWFQDVGIQIDPLMWAVHVAELGPAMLGDVTGRWHGLVDTNIILQFRDLPEIDWVRNPSQADNALAWRFAAPRAGAFEVREWITACARESCEVHEGARPAIGRANSTFR